MLDRQHFDCVVLDITLPGISGFDVLAHMQQDPATCTTPVLVHTARDLDDAERAQLRSAAHSVIVKDASSYDRLLAETYRFLNRSLDRLQASQRKVLEGQYRDGQADCRTQGAAGR